MATGAIGGTKLLNYRFFAPSWFLEVTCIEHYGKNPLHVEGRCLTIKLSILLCRGRFKDCLYDINLSLYLCSPSARSNLPIYHASRVHLCDLRHLTFRWAQPFASYIWPLRPLRTFQWQSKPPVPYVAWSSHRIASNELFLRTKKRI